MFSGNELIDELEELGVQVDDGIYHSSSFITGASSPLQHGRHTLIQLGAPKFTFAHYVL